MNPSHKNWQEETIGTVCVVEKGKKPKNSGPRTPLRTIPYINIKAFESGIPEAFAEPGNYPKCKIDDVLIVWDGARSGLVGRGVSGYIGSTLARIASDRLANPFLFYFLNSKYGAINSRTKGVGIPHINPQVLNEFLVPIPPYDEQLRIVSEIEKQLTRLDAGMGALRRVQAKLKKYRAAVLNAACEGRLVPTEAELAKKEGRPYETGSQLLARILAERRKKWQGRGQYKEPAALNPTDLPPIPEGWTWATLDALVETKGGITKDQARKHNDPTRSIPYLRVANVQRGFIDLKEVKEIIATEEEIQELTLKPGDILFNEGGDRDKLGRGWVWNGELPECIHQNHVFRGRLYSLKFNPKLVSWYANTVGQKFFFDEGKHTTNLASISLSKLRGLPVPISSPEEQRRIVSEVERRLSIVDELDAVVIANLQRAARLRQSVLQEAFAGNLLPEYPTEVMR